MTDHLQQRKRLQSVSLDGLVVDPGPPPGSTTDDPRSSMETFTFEDLKYLDFEQSSILKHLAQDLRRSSTEQLSRQPAMLNGFKPRGPAQPPINGPINGSRVQPDLTRSLTPSPKQLSEFNVSYDALRDENVLLRQEVDALVKKVARMLKLEAEVDKIHQSYLLLLNSTEKRELLENAMKMQLEKEKQSLMQENQQLRVEIERRTQSFSPGITDEEHRQALRTREMINLRLTAQNKELTDCQKRQDIELAAQRATLDEQRNHIHILDSALTSAQANVSRLEEELRKAQQIRIGPSNIPNQVLPNTQWRQTSEDSIRGENWQSQRVSTDSLNGDNNYRSSTEKIRSMEELKADRLRPLDVASQIKTTIAHRPDIAIAISKPRDPKAPTRAFGPATNRTSFPNLTALPVENNRPAGSEVNRSAIFAPTNHQRPKSAAGSVTRESRTEQWQV